MKLLKAILITNSNNTSHAMTQELTGTSRIPVYPLMVNLPSNNTLSGCGFICHGHLRLNWKVVITLKAVLYDVEENRRTEYV